MLRQSKLGSLVQQAFAFAALLLSINSSFSAPPALRSIAWVLELHSGLDHASQARDLKAQIESARASGAKIICVEFKGKPWRIDVAEAVGEALAASDPPALAFISSDSGEAPLAFLIAGSRAGRGCWIETGTTLVSDASGNARELARPEAIAACETFWKKSDAKTPFAPYEALRAAVLNPALGCWMLPESANMFQIGAGRPPSSAGPIIIFSEPGAPSLTLRAQDAVALGLAASIAPDSRTALETALASIDGSKPDMRERRPVGSTLDARRDRAESLLESAGKSMDLAQPILKMNAESTELAPGQKHEAAARAKPPLDTAAGAISEVELVLQSDPEILRLPAPGQTDTGQKPGQFESRWRAKLQQVKDRLEKLRAKADKLAAS